MLVSGSLHTEGFQTALSYSMRNELLNDLKVALVHDFLVEYGGAERVLEALHEIWPAAPLHTAFADLDRLGPHKEKFNGWKINTSWVQHIPFFKSKLYSPFRFLAPYLWSGFDFSKYDVVISSTNMYFAKNINVKKPTVHICYCHTPPRSLYGYVTARDWQKNFFIRIYGTLVNHFLRITDFEASQKPDYFIANSREVAARIKKFYRRDSTVIYPPVNIPEKLEQKAVYGDYFLVVSRLGAAKRVDVAIDASDAAGVKLKIVGKGPEQNSLRNQSKFKTNIEFLGEVSDEELAKLYRNCRAVLFLAQDEDFGIVPVEGMGYGKPVIGAKSGGVKETVRARDGILIDEPLTEEKVAEVLKNFDPSQFDSVKIRKHAQKFSKERFQKEIRALVGKVANSAKN